MAVHETIEEVVVHPTARRALLAIGESIVSARLAEEKQAKQALIALESLDVKSPDFETQLRALETRTCSSPAGWRYALPAAQRRH